jgi:pyruvate/2-oxoglutarate dehydrogenase complex dihydrolipoamide dehydrogenase (E3) component/uncharacterized membrane protein YdjX (TVP38/TMEM64 family)
MAALSGKAAAAAARWPLKPSPMKNKKIIVLLAVALALASYFAFDLGQYLDLAALKERQQAFEAYYQDNPVTTVALYFAAYVLITGLSLPGATIITLAGGTLFGLALGTLVVSFASTIGATLAFLASRYLLRDWVRTRFRDKLAAIDAGLDKDGPFYLFTLRLVPLFPFFAINLLMGLTGIRTWTFYWVSQLGMLAGTVVYVNAGTQLAQIDSASGILSPTVIASFALLGIFPLLAKWMLNAIKARRVYRRWNKPARFDRNLVVIGGGSAGLVASYIAAAVKAKVTLIEGDKMGGDCLNTGCVPSKALIRSARFVRQSRRAVELGLPDMRNTSPEIDFAQVMARVQRVVETVEPHDSVDRYTGLGVDIVRGHAKVVSPWEVEVNGRRISTRTIIIAAGARPFVPPIPGLDEVGYLTSDTLWTLKTLPKRLLVLGGGPIGCELAQAFAQLGSVVTQVEMASHLMGREDEEAARFVEQALRADGVQVMTGTRAVRCERHGEARSLIVEKGGAELSLEFDVLLCAVGRVARTEGYGLEELGIPLSPKKTVDTDAYLQTLYPNIYACGDVAGPYQFTHTAAHQAWFATVNALFGQFKRFRADYRVVPWCTFTTPEVARVGLSEQEARDQDIAHEITRFDLAELDRAITDEAAHGFVKVLTVPGKDRILGVTIVSEHAGEMIAEYVLAMKHGLGLNKILGTIHVYPTWPEANKHAAGEWKRAHAPQRVLEWLPRYHAWRRREQST